jgi:hypothetical protein
MLMSHCLVQCAIVLVCPATRCLMHSETGSKDRDVSYGQYRSDEGLETALEQLIRDTNACWVLCRRKGVLDHVFDVEIRPDLVEILPQVDDLGVGEHDKLHACGGFVIVKLVFAGAVGEKGVIVAAELGD